MRKLCRPCFFVKFQNLVTEQMLELDVKCINRKIFFWKGFQGFFLKARYVRKFALLNFFFSFNKKLGLDWIVRKKFGRHSLPL